MDLTVGKTPFVSTFFVVDGRASYNALVSRATGAYHLIYKTFCFFWNEKNERKIVLADKKPFAVNANLAEAQFNHRKKTLLDCWSRIHKASRQKPAS